jgi:hypothetical protein
VDRSAAGPPLLSTLVPPFPENHRCHLVIYSSVLVPPTRCPLTRHAGLTQYG